jgi:hypothetical protein
MDEILANNTPPIRCEDELTLQRLLDEELDADASELVFHHLKECARCAAIFHELKELKSLCHGHLGFEDESEAVYSTVVLKRVRDNLDTETAARAMRNASAPAAVSGDRRSSESEPDIPGTKLHEPKRTENRPQFLKAWFRSVWLRPATVTAVISLVLIGVLVFMLLPARPVSAAELLRKSISAEEAVAARMDQVLRRTVSLEERRLSEPGAVATESLQPVTRRRIETWYSAAQRLAARRVFDEENRLVAGEWNKADGSRLLYHDGTKPQLQPATAKQPNALLTSEKIWLLDVAAKDFSELIGRIDSARVEDRGATYLISYDGETAPGNAALVRANLVLSKADLHAIEQTLVVRSPAENQQSAIGNRQWIEYHFSETSLESRGPKGVAPAVFEPDPLLLAGEKPNVRGRERDAGASSPDSQPLTPATATTELEVEVLEKLNRVNAFLGEQLSLTRSPDGRLLVRGIVDTAERKNEILRSLGDVTKNPAVKIDVNTVAEAQAKQKAAPSKNITIQNVEVSQNTIPVEAELRAHLTRRSLSGEQLEKEIEQLSHRVLTHSSRARSHALALKQIAERFSPADLETMDASARDRWRVLIKEHANFFRRELEQVRHELAPIFPGANTAGVASIDIASDQDIARAAKRLFELAAVTDNGLRRSFTLSSEASAAPVKSQQFWTSFAGAQALAARMAN